MRLREWAAAQGSTVDEVVTEVGSGVNGKRRRFARLLAADPAATTIVVEHRDRLARSAWTTSRPRWARRGAASWCRARGDGR